jgi:hypothetical protein
MLPMPQLSINSRRRLPSKVVNHNLHIDVDVAMNTVLNILLAAVRSHVSLSVFIFPHKTFISNIVDCVALL